MTEQNNFCTFIAARHGQTEWNIVGRIQGHLDSPLTPAGEKQANDLAEELKEIQIDAIFSSDLLRAKRTAEIISIPHQLVVTTTESLRERKLGQLEGTQENELATLRELRVKNDPDAFTLRGIETEEEIVSRLTTFLRETAIAYSGKAVLLITHGSALRALLVHMGYGSHDDLNSATIANLAYIKFSSDGKNFVINEVKGIDRNE